MDRKTGIPAHRARRLAALAGGFASIALLASTHSSGPLRFRLVGVMHDNLEVLNSIYEALSHADYEHIATEAGHLEADAEWLAQADLDRFGLDAERDDEFDRHARVQAETSRAIAAAAGRRDASGVLTAVERLTVDGCIDCHERFREVQSLRTPPVLFMRNLLSSVQSMNRGVAMNDFSLVAREAREIAAIAHVFRWTQVVEMMFDISEPAPRSRFQTHLDRLASDAAHVEGAAVQRDADRVAGAIRQLVETGCVGCHADFYPEPARAGDGSAPRAAGPGAR